MDKKFYFWAMYYVGKQNAKKLQKKKNFTASKIRCERNA